MKRVSNYGQIKIADVRGKRICNYVSVALFNIVSPEGTPLPITLQCYSPRSEMESLLEEKGTV
jgi:hypothetical protein